MIYHLNMQTKTAIISYKVSTKQCVYGDQIDTKPKYFWHKVKEVIELK